MPPTAAQVKHLQQVLQVYRAQVNALLAKHKKTVKLAIQEVDRRKTAKLLKSLKKL